MYRKTVAVSPIVLGVIGVVFLVMQGIASAQKASVPNLQDKLALGEGPTKQLILLISTDENGKIMNRKITKQEWLMFMGTEFDRLCQNKSGEVDVAELAQAVRGRHTANR